MKAPHLTLLCIVALSAFGPAARARACSPLSCYTGEFIPHDGARIPANTPALGWRPPQDRTVPPARPDVMLIQLDQQARVDIDVIDTDEPGLMEILPSKLIAGVRYRLQTAAASCTTAAVEFEVAEEAPLPAALGAPIVASATRDELSAWTASGVCYSPLPVTQLSIELQRDADAEPWSDLFIYRTMVDDKRWAPTLEEPSAAGSTRIFAECPSPTMREIDPGITNRGLTLGKHKLRFEAKLLGASNVISSDLTFEFDCGAPESTPNQTSTLCSTTQVTGSGSRVPLLLTLLPFLLARRRGR